MKKVLVYVFFILLLVVLPLIVSRPTVQAESECRWNPHRAACDNQDAQPSLGYPIGQTTLIYIALAHGKSVIYKERQGEGISTLAVVGMITSWPAQLRKTGNLVFYDMSQEGVVGLLADMGENSPDIPVNGDGVCQPPETVLTTPADCAPLLPKAVPGDGICEETEDWTTAPQDCSVPTCGDALCKPDEVGVCAADCGK